MSERRQLQWAPGIALVWMLGLSCPDAGAADDIRPTGLGKAAAAATIAAQDIAIGPRGTALPPGRGTVSEGAALYASKCAMCHGEQGHEGPDPALVGGQGSLASDSPLLTIGSYWPYATTVYDYIYRAMPFFQPGSLSPDDVYALTAHLLHTNGIVAADAVIDRTSLPAVSMPNRDGFIADPRPDLP
ncbi:MAG: cytochrome c [Gammaproteobacteria bacterium]